MSSQFRNNSFNLYSLHLSFYIVLLLYVIIFTLPIMNEIVVDNSIINKYNDKNVYLKSNIQCI